jgi:hypothetical protein
MMNFLKNSTRWRRNFGDAVSRYGEKGMISSERAPQKEQNTKTSRKFEDINFWSKANLKGENVHFTQMDKNLRRARRSAKQRIGHSYLAPFHRGISPAILRLAVIMLLVINTTIPTPSNAQDSLPPPTIPSFVHEPPSSEKLPPPGTKMRLTAYVEGSKNFEQPVRVLLERDKKMVDIWLPSGKLDMNEKTFYEFTLHAPSHRMKYRFLLYTPEGETISSPEYSVERSCRFPLSQVDSDEAIFNQTAQNEVTEIERLFHVSESLNREILTYQEATRLLGELRKKIDSLKQTREPAGE